MEDILNFYQISPLLASSGQPTAEQFELISAAGYQVVINLALVNSSNAIVNEDGVVTQSGMSYLHLPVSWEQPQMSDFLLFARLMSALDGQKVWVHCAKNMRVSCFLYLYRKHILKWLDATARYPMNQLWQPDGVWAELINAVDHHYQA